MYSNPNSRSNSIVKLFRRRSTATTSGVGESLYGDDLEWDKSDFTRHLPESDALSSYDVNEMAEILRNRFLQKNLFFLTSQKFYRLTLIRKINFLIYLILLKRIFIYLYF
ncbi:unnamed protein product [Rotaria sp. Silwood2]|nr:unnamed protein product [Rotaria sp. Silwood2]